MDSPSKHVDLKCPHCAAPLLPFEMPDGGGWSKPVQWACFNDECSYYREGWDWMWEHYRAKASYRYRVADPATGQAAPLAVWSPQAIRSRIVAAPSPEQDRDDENPANGP
ncbi:MAG: hypothetical protein HY744_29525 [Deltaproteobacteria bacterium]|nr:hypothetical protein [Deltaproteobacteria bacterium]